MGARPGRRAAIGLEMHSRFRADSRALSATFGSPGALGEVVDLEIGLSDPHAHGRTVGLVTFASGARIVYKPRSLRVDTAFGAFLEWLSAVAPDLPQLRAVRTLDRGSYGWAEYVEAAPCEDTAAIARYHERCGALLAVAYVLRVGDLHSENVVAAGEHPLLIDLEAALGPALRIVDVRVTRARSGCGDQTVLNTSLLPMSYVDAAGRGYVEGGIAPNLTCLTVSTGAEFPDAVAAVSRGFDRAYRAMQANRTAILARGGPLAAFAGARVRMVLRATNVYAALLRRLDAPHRVNDPAARAAELNRLARPFRGRPEWARMLPAFAAEARALARGDVPRFELAANGRALRADGRVVVPEYAETSGLTAVRRRVRAMGDADRRRQLHYVRLAFAAEAHRRAWPRVAPDITDSNPGAGPPMSSAEALAEARRLGVLLVALAERSRDGRAARWQACDPASGAPTLRRINASLGHGQAGIGLVFAALHACAGHVATNAPNTADPAAFPDWSAWSRLALTPVCDAIDRGGWFGRPGTAGFASGTGGVALALARAAEWLDDRRLRVHGDAAAVLTARTLLTRGGASDHPADYDVFGGVAGAVHGLLAVNAQTRTPWLTECAARVGERLAATFATEPASRTARRRCRHAPGWEAVGGFGFGAPGRAAVLLRLATLTGDRAHIRIATTVLSSAAREVGGRLAHAPDAAWEQAGGWCRGDLGVGFALAAALAVGAPDDEATECWRAVLTSIAAKLVTDAPSRLPHALCCGVFARVELLLDTAVVLHAPDLHTAAVRLAHAAVARARRRLAYHLVPHAEPLAPTLFGGLAGVAHTLLRIARPEVVPGVFGSIAPSRGVEPALYGTAVTR